MGLSVALVTRHQGNRGPEMGRTKGSINKDPSTVPATVFLSTEERIEFLANLIVDRIIEDQTNDDELFKTIRGTDATATVTTA
jgi:hypothetical protein